MNRQFQPFKKAVIPSPNSSLPSSSEEGEVSAKNQASLKFIIGTQYFFYFGVMGIFIPYFNLYCHHIGFSAFQIGIISACRSLVVVLFSLLWSALADRLSVRKPIYIFCNVVSTAIWGLYLFTVDYRLMLAITLLYGIFFAPIISFLEAFTIDVLGKEKKSYGKIRVWGTIAFISVVTVLGRIIDSYPISIIIKLILIGSILQALFSIKIPNITLKNPLTSKTRYISKFLLNARTLCFLFCAFLMLVSHGAYYGFFSIHLEKLGYGSTLIGVCWALASVSEITVMICSGRIFNRFAIKEVLIFSFLIAGLRWAVLSFAEKPIVIIISQLSHAITYGTFHIASILYIDILTPEDSKTTGQAVNNAVTYGLGMMTGFFLSGWLYENMGASDLFMISALIAVIGAGLLTTSHDKT